VHPGSFFMTLTLHTQLPGEERWQLSFLLPEQWESK